MDPDVNLAEQLRIAEYILKHTDREGAVATAALIEDSIRLAELVIVLNEWVSKGGFLPKAWRKGTSHQG